MGKGTAYGSAKYLNYYRCLYIMYFAVAILYMAVWADISSQCKGVCPVASVTDLTARPTYEDRSGYDPRYLLPGIIWPLKQNASDPNVTVVTRTASNRLDLADCDEDRCSDTVLPAVYTHYFACNLTKAFENEPGGEQWWDNITTTKQWEAASNAGNGITNENYWGKGRKYVWDKRESSCYICCDPRYMDQKSKCRPSITSVTVFTYCKTSSECQSGFKPAPEFPVPPVMIWATFQGEVLLYLGIAYVVVGFFSFIVAWGYSVYSGKYELDFKEDNLSTYDKCCGALAKNGPWVMRLLNTGMFVLTIFQIFSLSTKTCFDGHDQFSNYDYFDVMNAVIIIVSAIYFLTCLFGTWFRGTTDADPAFYTPEENPDPILHGRSVIDLCCHDAYWINPCRCCTEEPRDSCECGGCKVWAACCLIKRRCCWAYVSCGP
jgi:hypothetical protein